MFKISTNVIGKLAYSTCYLLVRIFTTEFELEHKRFFFSFLYGDKINLKTISNEYNI